MALNEYRVTWEIDVAADSAEDAARIAQEMMRDPNSTATFFTVTAQGEAPIVIDLLDG